MRKWSLGLVMFFVVISMAFTVLEFNGVTTKSVSTAFATETWIGLDCSILDEELVPLCTDINVLNDRTVELEQLKLVDLLETTPIVTNSDKIIISAHSSYTHTAKCLNGGYITNIGFATDGAYLPPNPEMTFFIIESYQQHDNSWVYLFANPTDDNIGMKVVYSCIGNDQSK